MKCSRSANYNAWAEATHVPDDVGLETGSPLARQCRPGSALRQTVQAGSAYGRCTRRMEPSTRTRWKLLPRTRTNRDGRGKEAGCRVAIPAIRAATLRQMCRPMRARPGRRSDIPHSSAVRSSVAAAKNIQRKGYRRPEQESPG